VPFGYHLGIMLVMFVVNDVEEERLRRLRRVNLYQENRGYLHIFPLFIRYCRKSTLILLFNSPLKNRDVKKSEWQ
jgi:hypothetical protein